MKYIICDKPYELISKEKDAPAITKGSALLRVKRVGICGTDMHAYHGNQAFFSYPRILGHELAAEVLEVSDENHNNRKGDKVVVVPYMNCGECVACKTGKTNCCENLKVFGVHTDGGMQEIITFPTRLLIEANDLSWDEIVIVEPLSIGAHALRRAEGKEGEILVVMGCGPIGIGIIQLAQTLGMKVIGVDVNDYRLQVAKEQFGTDLVVNAMDSPIEKIKDFTGGRLADTVMDATGSKGAIEGAIQYMRHGGNLVLVGLTKGDLTFHHPAIHAKETTLMCSRNATMEDFEFVMDAMRRKKIHASNYITRRAGADTIVRDFSTWTSAESKEIKVVTTWN
jgi:2-desacetyl-2-hydroxyethyl bacteriochlorophyllide A dehydrogenase